MHFLHVCQDTSLILVLVAVSANAGVQKFLNDHYDDLCVRAKVGLSENLLALPFTCSRLSHHLWSDLDYDFGGPSHIDAAHPVIFFTRDYERLITATSTTIYLDSLSDYLAPALTEMTEPTLVLGGTIDKYLRYLTDALKPI